MNTLILILEILVNLIVSIIGIIIIIYLCYCWCHNWKIKRKYKRDRLEKDKKFKIMRCKEEVSKNRIYLVNTKKKEKTYQHIADPYTLNELGFGFEDASKNNKECFSKKRYKIGNRIKIYNLMVDIKQKIDLANEFKKLIKKD